MSPLEATYRRAVRFYPAEWRAANEDVVIGTLLDEAEDTGRMRPRFTEVASLAAHGVSASVGAFGYRFAGTRDRLASLAFGAGFALALVMFFGTEWIPWYPEELYTPAEQVGPFASATVLVNVLWFAGLMFAISGRRWLARVALLLTVPISVVAILLVDLVPVLWNRPPATALAFLMVLAVLASLGRVARRDVTAVAATVVVAFAGITALVATMDGAPLSWRPDRAWVIAAAGWWPALLVLVSIVLNFTRATTWSAPLLGLGIVWAGYSTVAGWAQHPDAFIVVVSAGAISLGAIVGLAANLFGRGYQLRLVAPQPKTD